MATDTRDLDLRSTATELRLTEAGLDSPSHAIARVEAALATGSLPSESERMRRADEASGAAVAERLAELAAELRDIGIGMDGI